MYKDQPLSWMPNPEFIRRIRVEILLRFPSPRCHLQILTLILVLFLGVLPGRGVYAQDPQPPKHEFRGAWIATVYGLDWPSLYASGEQQKNDLIQMLDILRDAGVNSIFFQVRAYADAMYASNYEPWSYYLTGRQGAKPSYDPLKFAIQEAHRRGMELHAWINPYRAHRDGYYNLAGNHVFRRHPEWTFKAGDFTVLDPGKENVRNYVSNIVMDIARNYDVDGIHMDDYFYHIHPITCSSRIFRRIKPNTGELQILEHGGAIMLTS